MAHANIFADFTLLMPPTNSLKESISISILQMKKLRCEKANWLQSAMIQSCTWAQVQRSPTLPSASQRVCEFRVWDVLTGALRPSQGSLLLSVVKWKTLLT